jgi:hypothetical protein
MTTEYTTYKCSVCGEVFPANSKHGHFPDERAEARVLELVREEIRAASGVPAMEAVLAEAIKLRARDSALEEAAAAVEERPRQFHTWDTMSAKIRSLKSQPAPDRTSEFDLGRQYERSQVQKCAEDKQRLERIATAVLAAVVGARTDYRADWQKDEAFVAVSAARALIEALDKEQP